MASAPPMYTPNDAPPSYEDVVRRLNELIGDNPTASRALVAAQDLSDADVEVLVREHESHYPLITEEEKKAFAMNLCRTSSSTEGAPHLKEASKVASEVAKEITLTLSSLDRKIAAIDKIHGSNFRSTILKIQEKYNDVLSNSQRVSTRIGISTEEFDDLVIKFCADSTLTANRRQKIINDYIEETENLKEESQGIEEQYDLMLEEFNALATSFSTWAEEKEGELTEEIKEINKELKSLTTKLADIEASAASLGIVGSVFLGVVGLLLSATIPFTSFLVIGGLIATGVSFATALGLIIAAARIKRQISDKESTKEELQQQIEEIRRTRADLEEKGQSALQTFSTCIGTISGFWPSTSRDAAEIKVWLEKGAIEEDQPQYMKANIKEDIKSYKIMGQYLGYFSRGIDAWRAELASQGV